MKTKQKGSTPLRSSRNVGALNTTRGEAVLRLGVVNKTKQKYKLLTGFTLIEILIVIGIIAVLAGIVLIAVNPARQFALARNAGRQSDLNALLNAIGQNIAENKGTFTCSTVTIPTTATNIGTTAGLVDLTCLTPTFISALPIDPSGGTDVDTKYQVLQDAVTGRLTVSAAGEAGVGTISITR